MDVEELPAEFADPLMPFSVVEPTIEEVFGEESPESFLALSEHLPELTTAKPRRGRPPKPKMSSAPPKFAKRATAARALPQDAAAAVLAPAAHDPDLPDQEIDRAPPLDLDPAMQLHGARHRINFNGEVPVSVTAKLTAMKTSLRDDPPPPAPAAPTPADDASAQLSVARDLSAAVRRVADRYHLREIALVCVGLYVGLKMREHFAANPLSVSAAAQPVAASVDFSALSKRSADIAQLAAEYGSRLRTVSPP